MSRLTSRIALLVVACAVGLFGCGLLDLPPTPQEIADDGQLEKGTPRPTAEADNLESAGHDPYPDLPTNPPPEAEYPGYPRLADVPRDRPTPKPTAEYNVDGLPAGAVTRLSRISSFIGATVEEGFLQTIPFVVYDGGQAQTHGMAPDRLIDGGPVQPHGIALVHRVEGKPAELLWDTSRYDDAPTPIIDVKSLYDRLLLVGTDDVALVELDVDPEGVSVSRDYRLGIVYESAESIGVEVVAVDIDADGADEHVVAVHIGSEEPVFHVVYEADALPRMREVARLGPHAQIMDLDLDGVAEVLEPRDDGGWNMQLYDGFSLSDADPIEAEPAVPAPVATDGELPALPADLYFHRDGGVYRWPRPGGSIETVWSEPPPPETSSGYGSADWRVMAATARDDWYSRHVFGMADDGSRAILIEQRLDPELAAAQRFRVIDPRAGSAWTAPVLGQLRRHGQPAMWEISPDGRWLVYVGYGATSENIGERIPGESGTAGTLDAAAGFGAPGEPAWTDAVVVVDLHAPGDPDARTLAPCQLLDETNRRMHSAFGCSGLSVAPDNRRVAYADDQGVLVAALPDGEPRLVLEQHYGPGEIDVRRYSPVSWSPDGSRLLLSVGHYEGSSSAILDLATGELQHIANTGEFGGPRSDITWLPDGSGIVHARPFKSDEAELSISVVDASDTTRVTDLLPQALHIPDGGYHPVSPHFSADGTVRYGMRHFRDDLYWASGIYASSLDGSAWSRLADLPLVRPDRTYHHDVDPGDVIWSPDGRAFVATESVRDWYPVSNDAVLGITSDGETLTWDVSDVLHGAWSLTWAE